MPATYPAQPHESRQAVSRHPLRCKLTAGLPSIQLQVASCHSLSAPEASAPNNPACLSLQHFLEAAR